MVSGWGYQPCRFCSLSPRVFGKLAALPRVSQIADQELGPVNHGQHLSENESHSSKTVRAGERHVDNILR